MAPSKVLIQFCWLICSWLPEALMPEKVQLLQAIQEMNDDVLKPEKVPGSGAGKRCEIFWGFSLKKWWFHMV